jgi:hypothetical protein
VVALLIGFAFFLTVIVAHVKGISPMEILKSITGLLAAIFKRGSN